MKNSTQDLKPFIPAWMFDCGLSCHEGWILAYLWRCRNAETGKCNPSAATIAKSVNLTSRKVFSCLKALADKGLIKIESGNKISSNQYELVVNPAHRGVMNNVHMGYEYYSHKGINKVINNNNLGVHIVHNPHMNNVHNLPRDENLGLLRNGELHAQFLRTLKPTLSPNAYRDYRVEVLGDGYASIISLYGNRTKMAIP